MRILLASHHFSPSIGGIETVSQLLAREFIEVGHEVRVVTFTPAGEEEEGSGMGEYPVLRLSVFPEAHEKRSGEKRKLSHWLRWCDVYFQNQIGLRTLGPWVFTKKPLVIAMHTWLKKGSFPSWLKQSFLHFAHVAYASQALALGIGLPGKVIYNPYDNRIFHLPEKEMREKDLIFVGRLVSEKGLEILLRALRRLVDEGHTSSLTIVGKGPEKKALCRLIRHLALKDRVVFKGELVGEALAHQLQRHQILVMPSLWQEPFGLVAVEAIACGCVVVGSSGGGLPEAIGPCGKTFRNGDIQQLSNTLHSLLAYRERLPKLRGLAAAHLLKFSPKNSANQYLDLFASSCRK